MNGKQIFFVSMCVILGLLCLVISYYFFVMKKPNTSLCDTTVWNSTCSALQEKYLDGTISKPLLQLSLGDFGSDPSLGNATCATMWYAARYVRVSDGGYGPLTSWSGPVFTGSSTTPCVSGQSGCDVNPSQSECAPSAAQCAKDGIVFTSQKSLQYNKPTIAVQGTLYPTSTPEADYFINIHRYFGSSPPSSGINGDIVGVVLPSIRQGWSGEFEDLTAAASSQNTMTKCFPQT